jgi:hypothetical protein
MKEYFIETNTDKYRVTSEIPPTFDEQARCGFWKGNQLIVFIKDMTFFYEADNGEINVFQTPKVRHKYVITTLEGENFIFADELEYYDDQAIFYIDDEVIFITKDYVCIERVSKEEV